MPPGDNECEGLQTEKKTNEDEDMTEREHLKEREINFREVYETIPSGPLSVTAED